MRDLTGEHDGLDVVIPAEPSEDCIGAPSIRQKETSRKEAKGKSWRCLLAGCRAFTGGLRMVMSVTPSEPTFIVTRIIVPAAMARPS